MLHRQRHERLPRHRLHLDVSKVVRARDADVQQRQLAPSILCCLGQPARRQTQRSIFNAGLLKLCSIYGESKFVVVKAHIRSVTFGRLYRSVIITSVTIAI